MTVSASSRHLAPEARPEVEALLASSLYARLVEQGDLIPGSWTGPDQLGHPRIALPTYAFEWTPAMLADAARLTLRIQRQAWAEGWSLKDASAHNVLFDGSRPRLCDLLSCSAASRTTRRAGRPMASSCGTSSCPCWPATCSVASRATSSWRTATACARSEVAALVPWYRHFGLDLLLRAPARAGERRRIAEAAPSPRHQNHKPRAVMAHPGC